MQELFDLFSKENEKEFSLINKEAQNLVNDEAVAMEEAWGVLANSEEWVLVYS